ncbi:nucleoside hydrolase-like domain-containing protein [Sunxiuqinia indica]|uniref:nucleoside hydrolase-like domain-containing protein n=1 Tax=Sunxiuqinia indica TaxID=2692584 RepID=UPI00135B92DF|nr:nucleoside hydrolase-like domain-containing protein [Sunxiuqinia indica]
MIKKTLLNRVRSYGCLLLITITLVNCALAQQVEKEEQPRLLVLTDIGADPDDIQSLRRLLLYANEFRLTGIIVTAAGNRRQPELKINSYLIDPIIDDYQRVQKQLSKHASGYPKAEVLRALVFEGEAKAGSGFLQAGKTTPGTEHIIKTVDSGDEILNIVVWGGSHDLAQALLNVKDTRSEDDLKIFISKIRIYAIADQYPNGFNIGTGEWIYTSFPTVFYIESGPSWMDTKAASFRGMYQNDSKGGDYATLPLVKSGIEYFGSKEWLQSAILNKGELGEDYPIVNQNPNTSRNTKGTKEGDTPSWFYFLTNGLSAPGHPEWGGWGGRFEHFSGNHFVDTQDDHWSGEQDGALRRKWAIARWREAYQNDFAARMHWCVSSFEKTNHNPAASINGDSGKKIILKRVKPGEAITIDASASSDPDGNKLSFNWWIYHEVSTTFGIITNKNKAHTKLKIPKQAPKGEIHIILEVKDDGTPNLVSYRRLIVNVI